MPEIFNAKTLSCLKWSYKTLCPTNQEHSIIL